MRGLYFLRQRFSTSQVQRQTAKVLTYDIQLKDYAMKELASVDELLNKNNVYMIRNFPSEKPNENLLLTYQGEEMHFGTEMFGTLTALKKELGVTDILGVHVVDNPTQVTQSSDIVKISKDFMKTQELRDALKVLFISQQQLRALMPDNADEALVRVEQPPIIKAKEPSLNKLMLVVVLNLIFLVGVSSFNLLQVKSMFGSSNKNKGFADSLKTPNQ